ncbi:MAG: hypothetical protein LBU17_10680, partial [Treponema sp.]|nr:hypothetical protein [Treponema sp.]
CFKYTKYKKNRQEKNRIFLIFYAIRLRCNPRQKNFRIYSKTPCLCRNNLVFYKHIHSGENLLPGYGA